MTRGTETPKLLLIQPSADCPPGRLGEWLAEAGADLEIRTPYEAPVPAGAEGFDGLVCLGGPMGARDDETHPWLGDVRRLLAAAHAAGTAVLGVCLGGQLLATALGGSVRRCPAGPEIGPDLVAKRDAASADPLFADVPHLPDVLQFHHDEIDTLPPGAVLLASSPHSANQAFRVGGGTYGLQFHIETTPEVVMGWAAADPDAERVARPGALLRDRLEPVHADIAEVWRPFAARFVQLAAGSLRPATADRRLPLA